MAQWVKNPPAIQETQEIWIQSLGWENYLGKEMASHSSTGKFCLENPMNRGAWRATVHGMAKSRTQLSD